VRRVATALALAAAAAPAAAYVLPATAVVKRAAERRAALGLVTLEAIGTLELRGAAAAPLGDAAGPRAFDGSVQVPARLLLAVPGRVRLELLVPDATETERPALTLSGDRLGGQGPLPGSAATAALARALATLLASPTGEEGAGLAAALVRAGVRLDDCTLGRASGRIAFVLGGRATDPRPLAFVDKETFLPLRLTLDEAGARYDVRLLDWGGPTGGDWFPRAVEVWQGDALLLRFSTERASANPKLPQGAF
jgi:hypothetical protein